MPYTPINSSAFQAAYAGAVTGLAVNGWITSGSLANYDIASQVAGAFAAAFDTVWNSAIPLNSSQVDIVSNAAQAQMTGRAVGNNSSAALIAVNTWIAAATAAATLVLQTDAYYASQGILQGFAPGTELVWQPNGVGKGPNYVITEAEVQPMIDAVNGYQFGFGKFIIDGSFNGGVVDINGTIDLKAGFDLEFRNVDRLNCNSLVNGTGVFQDVRENVIAHKQMLARRTNVGVGLSFMRIAPGNASTGFHFKNIIWDATTVGAASPGWFVNCLFGAPYRFWWEDCSLQPNLAASRVPDRLLAYSSVPDGGKTLELFWYGPNAGVTTAGNANYMFGASGGYNTNFTYGTFGGALISLAGITWAAAAPSVISRQP